MTLEEIFKDNEKDTDIFDGFDSISLDDYEKIDEPLEKTLDIEVLDLKEYLPNEDVEVMHELKEKEKEKDTSMQEAFINCSILCFVTAFIGAFWFINILKCL